MWRSAVRWKAFRRRWFAMGDFGQSSGCNPPRLWTLTVRLLNEIHENHLLSRSEYLLRETSRGSHRVVPRVITDHPTSTAPWVSDSIPSGPSIEPQGGTVATSRTVPEASEQEQ